MKFLHSLIFLASLLIALACIAVLLDPNVPKYSVDPIARPVLVAALFIFVFSTIWEIIAQLMAAPRSPQQPNDPISSAARTMKHADDFGKAAQDRVRGEIDVEDSRDQ